jgi:hypothetical protein
MRDSKSCTPTHCVAVEATEAMDREMLERRKVCEREGTREKQGKCARRSVLLERPCL